MALLYLVLDDACQLPLGADNFLNSPNRSAG